MSILTRPCSPFSPALRTVDPVTLRDSLRKRGCSGCELGSQKNFIAPVGFRGNPKSKVMLIGEAPGLYEDRQGIPFTGPCGKLLDEVFAQYGWDLNQKAYITNVVKCVEGYTRVITEDGKQPINHLVKHQYAGKVLSVNQQGDLEWQPVTGWHRTPLGDRVLYRITLCNNRGNHQGISGMTITEDHQVLTQVGYVGAKQLDIAKHQIQ